MTLLCGILSIVFLIAWIALDNEDWAIATIIGVICMVMFGVFSTIQNKKLCEDSKPAVVMESYDALIVKAPDWPEQISSNIAFLKNPVQVVRTTYGNSWGTDKTYSYSVELIEGSKKLEK